jgi:hypothetical protein
MKIMNWCFISYVLFTCISATAADLTSSESEALVAQAYEDGKVPDENDLSSDLFPGRCYEGNQVYAALLKIEDQSEIASTASKWVSQILVCDGVLYSRCEAPSYFDKIEQNPSLWTVVDAELKRLWSFPLQKGKDSLQAILPVIPTKVQYEIRENGSYYLTKLNHRNNPHCYFTKKSNWYPMSR